MPDNNPEPNPGGSASFNADIDPDPISIDELYWNLIDETDPTKITLYWSVNILQAGVNFILERKEGLQGVWYQRDMIPMTEDYQYNYVESDSLGAGLCWHYRVIAVKNDIRLAVSVETIFQPTYVQQFSMRTRSASGSKNDYTGTGVYYRKTEFFYENDTSYYIEWTPTPNPMLGVVQWSETNTWDPNVDYQGDPEIVTSEPYSTEQMISDTYDSIPEYNDNWTDINNYLDTTAFSAEFFLGSGRELNANENAFKLLDAQYKWKSSPVRNALQFQWLEVFVDGDGPFDSQPDPEETIINVQTWNVPQSTEVESDIYFCEGSALEENGGWYGLFSPILLAPMSNIGLFDFNVLTPQEKQETGLAITKGKESTSGFRVRYINEVLVDQHIISWSGSGAGNIQIFLNRDYFNGGDWEQISNSQAIDGVDISYGAFVVCATDQTQDGDSIVIEIVAEKADGTEISQDSCKFYYSKPKSLEVPVDEASGAKYRKISLNGRPLSDEKPQRAPEDDQQPEETFIDAMTLGLRHSTTDAYVPIFGSEMSLVIRRNSQSEVWTERNGLRPHERPDLPFGVAWNSNLTANVQLVIQVPMAGAKVTQPDYAYVTDENGASYRYVKWVDGDTVNFFPFPTAKHEQNTYLTTLEYNESNQLVFTRKFGSQLIFEPTTIALEVSQDRLAGSDNKVSYQYFRLTQITDRLGQIVDYAYETDGEGNPITTMLVPKTISARDRTDQTLYIRQNEYGLITSIWDANWNETQYCYNQDEITDVWLLEKVKTSDGAETLYEYGFATEADQTPKPPDSTDPGTIYTHCDITSITDPNGNTYEFDYMFDHEGINGAGASLGKYNYHYSSEYPEANGYYVTTGHSRMVKTVTLPLLDEGSDPVKTNLENYTLVKLINGDEQQAVFSSDSMRKTRVQDAEGNWRTYQWDDGVVYEINTINTYYDSDNLNDPKIVYYLQMSINHEGYGTETYTFDVNAGLNVANATDLSGNQTRFYYGDIWTDDRAVKYRTIVPSGSDINGRFEDPTSQERDLNN